LVTINLICRFLHSFIIYHCFSWSCYAARNERGITKN